MYGMGRSFTRCARSWDYWRSCRSLVGEVAFDTGLMISRQRLSFTMVLNIRVSTCSFPEVYRSIRGSDGHAMDSEEVKSIE
ncbi:hypothetical protein ACN42_g4147 [Penicillium freii]|uniref:Uncharacterized protein n=1 Tax=Penicillium freii TaxID=48697 RepID=A0A101MLW5_PENFR|nr:hypothetical protein ACN42_g4147 [Penicillium freii]